MTPERWELIKQLYDSVRAQPAADRSAFLAKACAGDEELERQIRSLLDQPVSTTGFVKLVAGSAPTSMQVQSRDTLDAALIGRQLGVYRLDGLLGRGGMGDVYRGRDLRLARDVAIKILPTLFTRDPERLARFEREARVLAALNHPNIGAIYGIEEGLIEAGHHVRGLVLELVEGSTLADRIAHGILPLDDAIAIARQIAEALEAAHEKGIVHRDLKPANIKVTPSGLVKVLDFGLAKTATAEPADEFSQSPTAVLDATREGVILGTAAYMSPEQARGQQVDKRTDVWAFGCVLFEMLTGRKAFPGQTVSDTIVAILEREPDWHALSEATPASIRRLLTRCVEKDVKRRLHDIADARIELEDTASGNADARTLPSSLPADVGRHQGWRSSRLRRVLSLSAPAVIAALATGIAVWMLMSRAGVNDPVVARLTVALRADEQIAELTGGAIALSHDGTTLAYVGRRGTGPALLYVRPINSLEARPLRGTEGAIAPFFSPDGEWLGFFAQANLKKVPVTGGIPQTLCNGPAGKGGSWGPDGTIYFAPSNGSGLWKVSDRGGAPQEVTKLDRDKGDVSHRWPQVLPGGQGLLLTVWTGPGLDEKHLEFVRLETGERITLLERASTGRYVSSGHLVFSRGEALMAVPFELSRLAVTGTPIALKEYVRERNEGALYAFSESGSLAYVPGSPQWDSDRRLVWVDHKGNVEPLPAPVRPYQMPRISPDGRYAAVDTRGDTFRIWIYDFLRATTIPLTSGASSQIPVWAADGSHIVYRGTRRGFRNLFWKSADGSGDEEQLVRSENLQVPVSFSPDGKWLAFHEVDPSTGYDIWVLPMDGDRKPQALLRTPFNEGIPRFSPDGQWLAYTSDESGRREIYVQPFPGPGRKWLISTQGGNEPVWSRDGRSLFYVNGDKMMAVDVATQPTFTAGPPRVLYEGRFQSGWDLASTSGYDVSPDGRRFLRVQEMEPEQPPSQINVVINWQEELKRATATAAPTK